MNRLTHQRVSDRKTKKRLTYHKRKNIRPEERRSGTSTKWRRE